MDGIILVVSAAEPIDKKPQLIQHIMAIKMSGIKNVIVLLNKLDLVKKSVAEERYVQLVNLLKKYDIEPKIKKKKPSSSSSSGSSYTSSGCGGGGYSSSRC